MAKRKKNREINVFSTSAIDLFASSLGVFIILVVILFPYFRKTSTTPPPQVVKEIPQTEDNEEAKRVVQELQEALLQVEKKKNEIEMELKASVLKSSEIEKEFKDVVVKTSEIKKELEDSAVKKAEVEKELKDALVRISELETSNKELHAKKLQPPPPPPPVVLPKDPDPKLIKEIEMLKAQLKQEQEQKQMAQSKVKELAKKIPKVETIPDPTQQLKDLVKTQSAQIEALKQLVKDKEDIITKHEQNNKGGSFMAIVMKWPSDKHDMDLVVKDPSGKTFDFKNRNFGPNYPGHFTLDSRTGPGVEVWQTDRIIPGRYTISVKLYNHYGNEAATQISTTIFSQRGAKELPLVKLDFKTKREHVFAVSLDSEGNVQL